MILRPGLEILKKVMKKNYTYNDMWLNNTQLKESHEKKVCLSVYYISQFYIKLLDDIVGRGEGCMEVVKKNTEFQVENIMDQLITEFTKCSDRSFLHDGEASKANMVRKYSGNDNVCVLYVIVMHCLKYFTTCTVFTRLVA